MSCGTTGPQRTCSDHGVCTDTGCRCDDEWTGTTCDLLRCPSCSGRGSCYNERVPEPFINVNRTHSPATVGMCSQVTDHCVAAWHDCPQRGFSQQVDATGVVIPEEPKHNHIVYARCECTSGWSGNDCSIPPTPPPTLEPWPEPREADENTVDLGVVAPFAFAGGLFVMCLAVGLVMRCTGQFRRDVPAATRRTFKV